MKVLSHSGYDVMTIEIEETPWWHPIFRKGSVREKYTGHGEKWRDSHGALVGRKKSLELGDLWVELRDDIKRQRDKARGR